MHHLTKRVIFIIAAVVLVLGLAACSDDDGGGSDRHDASSEAENRTHGVERQIANQPAHNMDFSPSRETINFWIDTWDEPGKLSFIYIESGTGTGYYVLEGLPVSYCAGITRPYDFENRDAGESNVRADVLVPAPGVDGVYYSGGACDVYYGKDASTGAYVEFSIGADQNYRLFTEPVNDPNAEPLGPTSVDEVSCSGEGECTAG